MSIRIGVAFVVFAYLVVGLGGCRSQGYDPRRGDRWWEDDDRGFPGPDRRPPVIRAPDLRPKGGSTVVLGEEVSIPAKVKNEGDFRADPFDVVAVVRVPGKSPETFTMRFFGLDPGEEFAPNIGGVSISGIPRPVDIMVDVTADPPTGALPRGEVIEIDETNNTRTFMDRIL